MVLSIIVIEAKILSTGFICNIKNMFALIFVMNNISLHLSVIHIANKGEMPSFKVLLLKL